MTTSPPVDGPSTTSVFNALGSYADRIKDANGKTITPPSNSSLPLPAPSSAPSSNSNPKTPSPNLRPAKSTQSAAKPAMPHPKQEANDDEGQWETVQSSRQRGKPEEKKSGANSSKNWRERPQKDNKEKEKTDQIEDLGRSKGKGKKSSSSSTTHPASSTEKPARSTVASIAKTGSKPAWGLAATTASTTQAPSTAAETSAITTQTPKAEANGKPETSSSPSINGTTTTASVSHSAASPSLSADSASTATTTTSVANRAEEQGKEEGSWRAGPKETEKDAQPTPQPQPVSRPVAPPPAVNPWDIRKKALSASIKPNGSSAARSNAPTPAQAGSVPTTGSVSSSAAPPQLPNGDEKHDDHATVNLHKKKTRGTAEAGPIIAALGDTTAWPDVATAAEVLKRDEERKEKSKERKGSEEDITTEEGAAGGKKTKWTAIPAAELLAVADEIAESNRRANATRKRLAKAESSSSTASTGKAKPSKSSIERTRIQQGAGEIRLPPIPTTSTTVRGGAPVFKPVFEPVPNTGSEGETTAEDAKDVHATSSAPLSRQTSQTSISRKNGSPLPYRASLPTSPTSHDLDLGVRAGSGPFSKPMSGSSTAPISQAPFHPSGSGSHSLPRVPRGREARGSFSARGRGGYRSQSHHVKGFTSPVMQQNGLPDPNNIYARGFGMGYAPPFYPNGQPPPAQGFQAGPPPPNGAFDPAQAGYMGVFSRPVPPPPPMPHTHVPNIDPLRFYVLGQVEYYFSMQNLAMDFFLRQQMDSEGWIDIPMIASFNRLKSLSSDIALVKEVMQVSSLLEVRDDKVRLVGEGAKRWVLPDAKLSTMPPDPNPPSTDHSSGSGTVNGSASEQSDQASDMTYAMQGLGIEDGSIHMPKYAPGDVENALMKSVPPSSSASILNGENEGDGEFVGTTPATSMSGDKEEDEGEKTESR